LLEQLMRAALVGSSNAHLAALIEREVPQQNLTEEQYALWLALGLLVTPEACVPRAGLHLKGRCSAERAYRLVGSLKDLNGIGSHSFLNASSGALAECFKLFGAILPPLNLRESRIDQFDRSQFIERLASELGNRLDDDS